MNLDKLRELWAAASVRCEEIRSKAKTEERGYTEEERATLDSALADMDRIDADIKREEAIETRMAASKPKQTRPGATATGTEVHNNAEDAPFRSFGEQLLAIRAFAEDPTAMDPRLRKFDLRQSQVRAASGMSETVAADGGFLVGTDTSNDLLRNALQESEVWNRARNFNITTNSNGMKFKTIDETSRANGSRWGGVQVYWAAEADTATVSKPKFGELELNLKKLLGLCYVTDEQLEDATVTEQVVSNAFSEEFGFKLDDAAIRGTGAGLPLGILTSPATVSVAKETSQAAASILYANVSKMRSRMLPRSYSKAVWFINVDCQPQIEQLTIPHKNVAGTENVGGTAAYMPPGGASANPYGTLLGRPVVPIEQCETVGTVGDIILADMGLYLTIGKGGMKQASSIHVKFLTDEMAFRFTLRVDGQPALKSAITPYKGAGTLSSFVTLATR